MGNTNQDFFKGERREDAIYFFFPVVKDIALQGSCSNHPVCHSPHSFQELHFSTTNIMVSHSQLQV